MKPAVPASIFVAALILSQPLGAMAQNPMDTDGDGLSDEMEDQNGNGVRDLDETDMFNADTDGGGESDGSEVAAGRDPLDPTDDLTFDADGDGLLNGVEAVMNTDPRNTDTDGDDVSDGDDPFPLDPRYREDANTNGLPDEWESTTKLDTSTVPQTKSDDPDEDGLTNAEEFARGTNPMTADTDRDGVDDKTEIDHGDDPSENACLEYATVPTVFRDTEGHWGEEIIDSLSRTLILPDHTALIRGYVQAKDAVFRPDAPVTRFEFLKMVLFSTCTRLRHDSETSPLTFRDTSKRAHSRESPEAAFRRRVIFTAVHHGVVQGYDDGTFRPNDTVNRAEALKILRLAARLDRTSSGAVISFSDVSDADWFAPYVYFAAEREIVQGHDDGTFRPGDSITRAEAAKIIRLTILQNPNINGYVLLE